MAGLVVRRASVVDLDAVEALERDCFSLDAQSRRSLLYLLTQANCQIWLAEQGEMLLGDVIVLFRKRSDIARIYSIAVAGAARGQGVAAALLRHGEQIAAQAHCTRMQAEVRISNRASRALFCAHGYAEIATLAAYYSACGGGHEDGLKLEKNLC